MGLKRQVLENQAESAVNETKKKIGFFKLRKEKKKFECWLINFFDIILRKVSIFPENKT